MAKVEFDAAVASRSAGSSITLSRVRPCWDPYSRRIDRDLREFEHPPEAGEVYAAYGGGEYKLTLRAMNEATGRFVIRAVKFFRIPGDPIYAPPPPGWAPATPPPPASAPPPPRSPRPPTPSAPPASSAPPPVQWSYLVTVPAVPCSSCATPLPFAHARCPSCGTQTALALRERSDDEHLVDFIAHADRAGTPHTKAVARAVVRLRSELSQLRAAATKGTP